MSTSGCPGRPILEALNATKRLPDMRSNRSGLLLIGFLSGFAGNYSLHVINTVLQAGAASAASISVSTAVQATGIVTGAFVSVRLLNRLGSEESIKSGILLAAASLMLMLCSGDVVLVTAMRFMLGIGLGIVATLMEYVLLARCRDDQQGAVIASYITFLGIGAAIAPVASSYTPADMYLGFGSCALILLLTGFQVSNAGVRGRRAGGEAEGVRLSIYALAPLAFVTAMMFGMMENGLLSLVAVFGQSTGLGPASAVMLATAGFAGALLFQIPAGHLSDRYGPLTILRAFGLAAFASSALLFLSLKGGLADVFLMIIIGGCCESFCTLGLVLLGRSLPAERLAAGNACFVAACGVGEVLGPLLSGAGAKFGSTGPFAAFALLSGAYLLLLRWQTPAFRTLGNTPIGAPRLRTTA